MAKVAHEGNPKYDNIRIVEGDILSEAELEVTSGGDPPPPGPAPTPPGPVSSSCPDVISWTRFDGLEGGFRFTDSCGQSVGWTGNDPPHYTLYDKDILVTLNPHIDCYGAMWSDAQAYSANPHVTEMYCSFRGLVTGTPIVGIAMGIDPDSSHTNFSGVTLVYNFGTSTVHLLTWANADLASIDNATSLADSSVTLTDGDIFYMQIWQQGSTHTIYAAVVDENADFGAVRWETTIDPVTVTNYNTFGLVALGGTTSLGTVRFGSSQQGDCTGDPQLTIRVETDNLP